MRITHSSSGRRATPVPLADRERRYKEVRKHDKTYTREDLCLDEDGDKIFYLEGCKGMYHIGHQEGMADRRDPAGGNEWEYELDFYQRTANCVAFTSPNR